MNQRVLLFDLNPDNKLGRALQEMIEFSLPLKVEYRHFSLNKSETLFAVTDFCSISSPPDPDLIFLIASPALFEETCLLIKALREKMAATPLLVVKEENGPEEVIELLKLGVSDYIVTPLKIANIYPRVWRLVNQRQEEMLSERLKTQYGLKQLIGDSDVFMAEIKKIPRVAKCDASVLILGETGTGKELCARAIHYLSTRADNPFIPVNCGAIPLELVENELFGHVRGAFTGATTTQSGLVSEANGGTLFLDEIDCLPLLAQVKLLRFLQDKAYRPLGSAKKYEADVRVIAATNVDLQRAVREGRYRQDLYYRLNVISLVLPPLREREADVLLLARYFLLKYSGKFKKPATDFSPGALRKLMSYNWPGNVRELENVVERAVVFSDQQVVDEADLNLPYAETTTHQESFQEVKSKMIEQFEKSYIKELLMAHNGNITKAAQAARKNRRAFWQLIRKHNVDLTSFRAVSK